MSRHPVLVLAAWLTTLGLVVGAGVAGRAQNQGLVVRDGSLGDAPAGVVPPGIDDLGQHADYLIGPELGQRAGPNLFHSFDQFSIGTGEVATFTGPASVEHVVSRVTGGEVSSIDGTLRSTIRNADVYLLNPAGMLFGAGAELDVSGSFHVTTADYLRFADGERFEARADRGAPLLAVARPEAFGFLGPEVADVRILGSSLFVPPNEVLSVVAGDIVNTGGPSGLLVAPGGRIELVSVASAGEATLGTPSAGPAVDGFARLGTIRLSDFAVLGVVAPDRAAGSIYVRGGELTVDDHSVLGAGTLTLPGAFSQQVGGVVDIAVEGTVVVSGAGVIDVSGSAAGERRLRAGSLTLDGGGVLASAREGEGGGVDVRVTDQLRLQNGSLVIAGIEGPGRGPGISLEAGQLLVSGSTVSTQSEGSARAGDISIDVGRHVELSGGALLGSATLDPASTGGGGSVRLRADSVAVDDAILLSATTSGGNAGDIDLELSGGLEVRNGGMIRTLATDPGVSPAFLAGETGDAGDITIVAENVEVDGGAIESATEGGFQLAVGHAGQISITARDSITIVGEPVTVESVDQISSDAFLPHVGTVSTNSLGDAGDVTLRAEEGGLSIVGFAAVNSNSLTSFGDSGDVTVVAPRVELRDGGVLATDSRGFGDAGDVAIRAAETLSLVDLASITSTALAGLGAAGSAGDIRIEAPELAMRGSSIRATTAGLGDGAAGNIQIRVGRLHMDEFAEIANSTQLLSPDGQPVGSGGRLEIEASQSVEVLGGGKIANDNLDGAGDRLLRVRTPLLVVDGVSGLLTSAAGAGDAGAIELEVDTLIVRGGSVIDSGTVTAVSVVGDSIPGGFLFLPASTGSGGTVRIDATQSVQVSGAARPTQRSAISASTSGLGDAGGILIESPSIEVLDGGMIAAGTETLGVGQGGSVELNTQRLRVAGGGEISTSSVPGATLDVDLDQGTMVETPVLGSGAAGDVAIQARDEVMLVGAGSEISSGSATAGPGGDVRIDTASLLVEDGAVVAVRSTGSGDAGEISIGPAGASLPPRSIVLRGGAEISAEAIAANGGNVTLQALELVSLTDSTITASVGDGVGGNVTIDPEFVVLDSSDVVAQAGAGRGGEIRIHAGVFLASPDSVVSASAGDPELSGTVEISAPDVDLAGQINKLPESFLDASVLLQERCGARGAAGTGSFTVRGPLGVPPGPDGMLPALAVEIEKAGSGLVGLPAPPAHQVAWATAGCEGSP